MSMVTACDLIWCTQHGLACWPNSGVCARGVTSCSGHSCGYSSSCMLALSLLAVQFHDCMLYSYPASYNVFTRKNSISDSCLSQFVAECIYLKLGNCAVGFA